MDLDQKLQELSIHELFENAPCGYVSTLPDGKIVQVNQTFISLSGYPREWLLSGRRFSDLFTIPGQIYHDTHIAPLLQMQGFVNEVAVDLLRLDRRPLHVLINAVGKTLAVGGPSLTLITVFDASHRRKYEHELLLAKRRAEAAIAAERAAREQAEIASRTKDEFLAMVSHELRTPLNAILGWTQLLQDDRTLNQEQRQGLEVIERNAQAQTALINDLLDMGRIISGKLRLDVQTVWLHNAIEEAVTTIRPAADAKDLRLHTVLDPSVVVAGDPGRLQQVFWNLLINAVKFTPKGGSIRIVMQRINSHVEVSVADSGQGMSKEFLAHAFERFRQSVSGETQRSRGLGLGLSIVKNLIEMHGGSIQALSEGQGKGSTFVISLPITALHSGGEDRVHPRMAVTASPYSFAGITLKGVKVLVVDDEADAREMVRRVLAASGADVEVAGSAAEALVQVENFMPHVLVSDIGLLGDDGYELIRKIRMLGEGMSTIRAVALTAFARLDDRTRAMLAGYQMHLAKPVDARELIVTVATLAGRCNPQSQSS